MIAQTFNTGQVIWMSLDYYRPKTRLERVLEDDRVIPYPKLTVYDPGLGEKGIRDSDYPCDAFDPGRAAGTCDTDGHYICIECKRLNPNSEYAHDDCPKCTHWSWQGTECPDCDGSGRISRLR